MINSLAILHRYYCLVARPHTLNYRVYPVNRIISSSKMKELQMGENIRSAEPLVKQVLVADRSKSSIEIIPSSTNSSIDQPIPLSFPSLLVNPRLRHVTADIETARLKPTRRELRDSDSEGSKRYILSIKSLRFDACS